MPDDLPGVDRTEVDGNRVVLHTPDADELVRALVRHDVPFADLAVSAPRWRTRSSP